MKRNWKTHPFLCPDRSLEIFMGATSTCKSTHSSLGHPRVRVEMKALGLLYQHPIIALQDSTWEPFLLHLLHTVIAPLENDYRLNQPQACPLLFTRFNTFDASFLYLILPSPAQPSLAAAPLGPGWALTGWNTQLHTCHNCFFVKAKVPPLIIASWFLPWSLGSLIYCASIGDHQSGRLFLGLQEPWKPVITTLCPTCSRVQPLQWTHKHRYRPAVFRDFMLIVSTHSSN